MMVYLAVAGGGTALPVINDLEYPQILNSFAYKKGIEGLTYQPKELTLDSGAFTAWNSGKSVDIDLFKTWALSVKHPNLRIVNLDVIPGEVGRTSTKDERIAGMKKSLDNADYLRAAGLNVMEVFHQDEPWDFLDLLVKRLPDKESVLCISPRNDVSTKSKIEWHRQVLKRLVDTVRIKGLPRMHGLAVTGKSLVIEFPYYSVDSSSFMTPAQYGRVLDHEGKWVKSEELLGHQFRDDKNGGMSILIRRMIEEYTRIETLATSVWKGRGIVWE
jgi:hypothetical protein